MSEWRLLRLGKLPGLTTQTIWHACGLYADQNKGMNIIILSEPTQEFVCCGQSQDVYTEVDVEFCDKNNIGYTRRIAGGTTVFLDNNQIFYNVILYDYNFPVPLKALYKKSLIGPINFYKSLNLDPYLNAYNEISVGERKISGIGACSLDKVGIVVGNIILDFNYDRCVETLRFPSNNFKFLFKKYLLESVTSLQKELEQEISKEEIYDGLISAFEEQLKIKLVEDKLTKWEIKKNAELETLYQTEEWLSSHSRSAKKDKKFVKIKKGQFIFHSAPLNCDFVVNKNVITEIISQSADKEVLTLKGLALEDISDHTALFKDLKQNLIKYQAIAES